VRYTLHGSATGKIASKELIGLSYAVVRMVKLKSHDLKGIQFHNQRERESKTNPDIDSSNTENNYDLVNESNIDYNKRVKEIIESQKEGTRKTRKDAVLVNEFIVTSDASFFDKLSPADERTFFEESLSFFAERYGKQNIAFSMVHKDEKTPHMHVGVVPMRDGRLQGKNIFNRQELLWLQEEFPKHMQQQGFELQRGEKGSNREHIETAKFKQMALESQIETLENQLADKKKELLAVTEDIPTEELTIRVEGHEVKTQVKQKIFGNAEVTEKETANLVVQPKELKKVEKMINAANRVRSDYERLLKTDIVQENKALQERLNDLYGDFQHVQEQNTALHKQNKALSNEVMSLKATVSDLRGEIEKLYKTTKEFLKARTEDARAFKTIFKQFVDDVRAKIPYGEFKRVHEREGDNEQGMNMERVKNMAKELDQKKPSARNKSWDMER
jgi:hypothetical protein